MSNSAQSGGGCFDPAFFSDCPMAADLMRAFDHLPRVVFSAKDRDSVYVAGNRAMLESKGLQDGGKLLGKTDREFHTQLMAEQYIEEDRQVIESGEAVTNEIWYVMSHGKRPRWFNCSKLPLHGPDGSVVGLAVIRFPVRCPTEKNAQLEKLAPAIRILEERHHQQLSMEELAGLVGMSSTHFNRQFASLLGTSPTRLLHAMRIDRARHLLATTDQTIADIATEVGYYDQSHFTRRFHRHCGRTPRAYRKQFGGGGEG